MSTPNIKTKFSVEGEKEYKQALTDINSGLKVLGSEMKVVKERYAGAENSTEALAEKSDVLSRKLLSQKEKVETLEKALRESAQRYGESDKRTQQWQTSLNNAQAELIKTQHELDETNKKLEETEKSGMGLGDAADKLTSKFGINLPDGLKNSMNGLGKLNTSFLAIVGTTAAVATAIAKVEKSLISMTKESAAAADNILTLEYTTGLTAETIQELQYASELIDVSFETIEGSMTKMIRTMGSAKDGSDSAAESFEKLGVNIYDADGNLRDAEDVFNNVIDALGQMQNETERDATSMEIFGKSARDLNSLIEQGSGVLNKYRQEAHDVNYVLDGESLDALGAVDDAYQRLQKSQEATKNQLSAEFAPYLEKFFGSTTKFITTLGNSLKQSGIVDAFGMLLETFGNIIAPADKLSNSTIPALVLALRPLAVVMASIADALKFINSLVHLDFKGMGQALGFGYSKGNPNSYQAIMDSFTQMDTNAATKANGYGSYYANGKYYANYDAYLMEEYQKNPQGSFEYWKMANGYNAGGTDNWRGGWSWVGENGAELVHLPRGSQVYSAQDSMNVGGDTFNISINASTIKEFNDIIRMAKNQRLVARMG